MNALQLFYSNDLLEVGDSLSTGFGAGTVSVTLALEQLIVAQILAAQAPTPGAPFMPSPASKAPQLFQFAAPGRTTVQALALMPTIRATCSTPKKKAIFWLSVNDALAISNGTETLIHVDGRPDFSSAMLGCVDDLRNNWGMPYSDMLWVKPWALNGGAAAAIAQVEAQIDVLAALRPGLNTTGILSDIPFTVPTFSPDGIHPNTITGPLLAGRAMASINLVAN